MQQLTVREHIVLQLRRAPSFAVAACVVALGLLLSAFITFSVGRAPALALVSTAGLAEPERSETLLELKLTASVPRKVKDRKMEPRESDVDRATESPDEIGKGVGKVEFEEPKVSLDPPETWEGGNPFANSIHVIGQNANKGIKGPKGPYEGRKYGPHGVGGGKMPPGTGSAINRALRWLAQAQDKKTGGWDVKRWGGSSQDSATGVSGLALLAFLSSGCNDVHPRRYTKTVRTAVEFLISQQRSQGSERGWFGARMYTQGICTMALSEASVLLRNPRLKREARRAAQNGIDYIVARQADHGGFGYTGPGTDTSVTGWQVMAIKSAEFAGLRVPKSATTRTENFLQASLASDGSTPYRFSPSGGSATGTQRMTAVSLTARLFMGHKRDAEDCVRQVRWLVKDGQHLKIASAGADLYHIYYTSMAMFHTGGKHWRAWSKTFNAGVRARQVKVGPDKGSWPVAGSPYGPHGGRVYTTAMACLSLEVYIKHLPLYKM